MKFNVKIHKGESLVVKQAEEGCNLLRLLQENSFDISTPCGGKGTCGKCRVRVKGIKQEASDKEKKLLGADALADGYRLACYSRLDGDIEVFVDKEIEEANILTEGKEREINLQPIISKRLINPEIPSLEDQRPDIDRISESGTVDDSVNLLKLMRKLPQILRSQEFKATLVYLEDKLIGIESGDTRSKIYGIAVDIGTTTVAAYLLDLVTGKRIDVYSVLNSQKKYGADVLSRIEYTNSSEDAQKIMNDTIINCINGIIEQFSFRNDIRREDIYAAVFVGNTTMTHFLMGLPARFIAVSPFIPVTTDLHVFNAPQLGININSFGAAVVFPGVAAYIGADTVAAVLSSGMNSDEKVSLLVDIGTNGEIVLGNKDWMYSCSTAAGPAFEGANIRNGVGGIKGAIDSVKLEKGIEYTTIGKSKAVGICGSGIVDIIAGMLSSGIIDETGRIPGQDELDGLSDEHIKRLTEIDGQRAFIIARKEDSAADMDIAVTQKDIRELQNAKAAIAAGIKILVKRAGIKPQDVDKVYLAGGFGSHINLDSALAIGLIPQEFKGKIESIGNAAGTGAIQGLLSVEMLHETEVIKNKIKYIELSSAKDFVDEYVECMFFE